MAYIFRSYHHITDMNYNIDYNFDPIRPTLLISKLDSKEEWVMSLVHDDLALSMWKAAEGKAAVDNGIPQEPTHADIQLCIQN